MKKIIFVLCGIMICGASFGITLCKKNNTAIAVLNKIVGGTPSTSGMTWTVAMTDGNNVRGKALCSSMPGTFATVNTGVADTVDQGTNCFCKMMGPATSYWVFAAGGYTDNSDCESNCATLCAGYMAGSVSLGCAASVTMNDVNTDDCLKFRDAVYESIW